MKKSAPKKRPKTLRLTRNVKDALRAFRDLPNDPPTEALASDEFDSAVEELAALGSRTLPATWKKLPTKTKLQLSVLESSGLVSEDLFKNIVVTAMIVLRPPKFVSERSERIKMIQTWEDRLRDLSMSTDCMTLKRALRHGLVRELVKKDTFETDIDAWRLAAILGAGSNYNRTQTLPGYKKARESVHKAIQRKKSTVGKIPSDKGVYVKMLAPAMLTYWLPLGLWSMSPTDALEALRLFSAPKIFSGLSDSQKEKADWLPPNWEANVLQNIRPKERRWHNRFSNAVRDLQLYRSKCPMVALEFAGTKAKEREDTDHWKWIFKPGFNCAGRW